MTQPRVAVIGAGPCGLAAAKYLLAEKTFARISVFDQRNVSGGLWNYTSKSRDPSFTVPHVKPSRNPETMITDVDGGLTVVSPIYDSLETNIPKGLMGYSDTRFLDDTPLFPRHAEVKEYLRRAAEGVQQVLRLGMQVKRVGKIGAVWRVRACEVATGKEIEEDYEGVVVASGHFSDPYVPEIPGLAEWADRHPGTISHSKFYRRASDYAGKRMVVVGNSASGLDIAVQLSPIVRQLFISEKTPSTLGAEDPRINPVPPISRVDAETHSVHFTDGTQQTVDGIIFCTGYMYGYPFLEDGLLGDTQGAYVKGLWRHMVCRADPTVMFLGIPQRVVPFPVAEGQAAVSARILAGRLKLPGPAEMEEWETNLLSGVTDERKAHELVFPKDAEYVEWLHQFAETAERREGLQREGRGLEAPMWSEETVWIRGQVPKIKLASRKLGEARSSVKTLADLGFVYPGTQ